MSCSCRNRPQASRGRSPERSCVALMACLALGCAAGPSSGNEGKDSHTQQAEETVPKVSAGGDRSRLEQLASLAIKAQVASFTERVLRSCYAAKANGLAELIIERSPGFRRWSSLPPDHKVVCRVVSDPKIPGVYVTVIPTLVGIQLVVPPGTIAHSEDYGVNVEVLSPLISQPGYGVRIPASGVTLPTGAVFVLRAPRDVPKVDTGPDPAMSGNSAEANAAQDRPPDASDQGSGSPR